MKLKIGEHELEGISDDAVSIIGDMDIENNSGTVVEITKDEGATTVKIDFDRGGWAKFPFKSDTQFGNMWTLGQKVSIDIKMYCPDCNDITICYFCGRCDPCCNIVLDAEIKRMRGR